MDTAILELFHFDPRMIVSGWRSGSREYDHWFGSPVPYQGLKVDDHQYPVDTLFRLDARDPLMPFRPKSARFVPLLCAVHYYACPLAYRMMSDDTVEIKLWSESGDSHSLDSRVRPNPVCLEGFPYGPDDPDDVLDYAGIYGFDHLSDQQYEQVLELLERRGQFNSFSPDISPYETVDEWLKNSFVRPFIQGIPDDPCPNPGCRLRSMRVLATYSEENAELWKGYGESPQVIWQYCPRCEAVLAISYST